LLETEDLEKLWLIRKHMSDASDFTDQFIRKMKRTKSNQEFMALFESATEQNGGAGQNGKGTAKTTKTTAS
jgi:transcription termination factor Rho